MAEILSTHVSFHSSRLRHGGYSFVPEVLLIPVSKSLSFIRA